MLEEEKNTGTKMTALEKSTESREVGPIFLCLL